jgi:hypothetical protein
MEEIIELSWKTPCPREWTKQDEFLFKGKWRLNIEEKYRNNVYIHSWCDETKEWRYRGVVGNIESAKRYCEVRM